MACLINLLNNGVGGVDGVGGVNGVFDNLPSCFEKLLPFFLASLQGQNCPNKKCRNLHMTVMATGFEVSSPSKLKAVQV